MQEACELMPQGTPDSKELSTLDRHIQIWVEGRTFLAKPIISGPAGYLYGDNDGEFRRMHYDVRHYWKYPMPLLVIPHAILRDHERVHRHELISLTNTFVLLERSVHL